MHKRPLPGSDVTSVPLEVYHEVYTALTKGTGSVQEVPPLEEGFYKLQDLKQIIHVNHLRCNKTSRRDILRSIEGCLLAPIILENDTKSEENTSPCITLKDIAMLGWSHPGPSMENLFDTGIEVHRRYEVAPVLKTGNQPPQQTSPRQKEQELSGQTGVPRHHPDDRGTASVEELIPDEETCGATAELQACALHGPAAATSKPTSQATGVIDCHLTAGPIQPVPGGGAVSNRSTCSEPSSSFAPMNQGQGQHKCPPAEPPVTPRHDLNLTQQGSEGTHQPEVIDSELVSVREWLVAQIEEFQTDLHPISNKPQGPGLELVGARIVILLMDDLPVVNSKGHKALPRGMYQARVTRYLGMDHDQEVCDPNCTSPHQFHLARILPPVLPGPCRELLSGGKVEVKVDLHPSLRCSTYLSLLRLSPAQLQDVWMVLEWRDIEVARGQGSNEAALKPASNRPQGHHHHHRGRRPRRGISRES